jgi:hypothetical protein
LQNSARRRRPPSGLVASLERLLACFPSLRSFETDLLGIYALHVLHALTPGLCELTIEDNSCLLVPKAVCASAVGSLRALRSAVFLLNNESNSLLSGLLGALPTLDALDTLQMIMETNSKAEFTRVYSAVSRATSLTRLAFGGLWLREQPLPLTFSPHLIELDIYDLFSSGCTFSGIDAGWVPRWQRLRRKSHPVQDEALTILFDLAAGSLTKLCVEVSDDETSIEEQLEFMQTLTQLRDLSLDFCPEYLDNYVRPGPEICAFISNSLTSLSSLSSLDLDAFVYDVRCTSKWKGQEERVGDRII